MQDSRPASGAEHLISHAWEMDNLEYQGVPVSLGFKVALGSLLTTAMMTELCTWGAKTLKKNLHNFIPSWEERELSIKSLMNDSIYQHDVINICKRKFLSSDQLVTRRKQILAEWTTMTDKISKQIITFEETKRLFEIVGCPTEPGDIGLTKTMCSSGILKAQMLRERYTILDLLYELGILDEVIHSICNTGTYFSDYIR